MELDIENYKNTVIESLGIGLTNRCNLNCPHCYSRPLKKCDLSLSGMKSIMKCFPNLKKVNFGTGESFLCPDFKEILRLLNENDIATALTTNGATIKYMTDKEIRLLKDVDVSLDFPNSRLHDKWRGVPETFDTALDAIERCQKLGTDTSIAMALMNHNYEYLPEFREILDAFKISLRMNIFKPIQNNNFELSYNQFWEAMEILSKNFKVISISEPILATVTDITGHGSPCGSSLRIHPNLNVTGCVYLNPEKVDVDEFNNKKEKAPDFCKKIGCKYIEKCMGGCFGRRILQDRENQPDKYCPLARGEKIPEVKFEKSDNNTDFIHAGYLCTIIVD
jgi:radical SAM protein with 4Fe4S-binding SPASM domain